MFANHRNISTTLTAMADYRAFRENFLKPVEVAPMAGDRDAAAALLERSGRMLSEHDARRVLATYGIGDAPPPLADGAEASAELAGDGSVVLKVQSADIPHKTDAGAIALNVQGADAVAEAFAAITDAARAFAPAAVIEGVSVQPMAADGIDVIVGIHRDEKFGPMMMIGLGGIHVEILNDVQFTPVPVAPAEARRLIGKLKAAAILDGARGRPAADLDALIDVIVRLSQFAADFRDRIDDIDLNPVRVHADGGGVSILDAFIMQRRTP